LATNASTIATLPLNDILDPKGYVAALAAKWAMWSKSRNKTPITSAAAGKLSNALKRA
jgi:hypothetical protein